MLMYIHFHRLVTHFSTAILYNINGNVTTKPLLQLCLICSNASLLLALCNCWRALFCFKVCFTSFSTAEILSIVLVSSLQLSCMNDGTYVAIRPLF